MSSSLLAETHLSILMIARAEIKSEAMLMEIKQGKLLEEQKDQENSASELKFLSLWEKEKAAKRED